MSVSKTPPVKLAGVNCQAEGVAGVKGAVRGRIVSEPATVSFHIFKDLQDLTFIDRKKSLIFAIQLNFHTRTMVLYLIFRVYSDGHY